MPRYIPLSRLEHFEAKLRDLAYDGRWWTRRNAIACTLGLHGLRVGEVCNLSRQDFDSLQGTIFVSTEKGGRDRELPLGEGTMETLRAFLGTHEAGPLLPTSTGRQVHPSHFRRFANKLTKEMLGQPLKFHCFRHTYGTWLYNKTQDLLLVKRALGHRSIESTLVYAESLTELRSTILIDLVKT